METPCQALAAKGRLQPVERSVAMVPTMLKRVVVCAVLTVWMCGAPGCGKQSAYDAKVAELHKQAEKLAKTEKQVLQLQKDLDAAKREARTCTQSKNDLEATIKTLELNNTGLKDQVSTLERKNLALVANADEKASQFQKDLDAAKEEVKEEVKKAQQAKESTETKIKTLEQENADLKNRGKKRSGPVENLSGAWEITYGRDLLAARLEALGSNNYRLGPQNLGFSGIYLFDGATLSMVGENPGYPDLVWSRKKPGLFEMAAGHFAGASMRRIVAGGPNAGQSKP
jgi:cell division protein FtsB